MAERIGKATLNLKNTPTVLGVGAVVGKKEGEGPLGEYFDEVHTDTTLGKDSWEEAESELMSRAVNTAIGKAGLTSDKIHYIFAGDLLNQCVGSVFALKDLEIPYIGLFGACSTMALSLGLASVFVDSGTAEYAVATTSSHFCSAERQFRFPLDYGGQRTPTSQWTVTGSGAVVLGNKENGPKITKVTFGKPVDLGVKDANNMGAAMAPAAADTISQFFKDTNASPDSYDLILTGDLGEVGSELLTKIIREKGVALGDNYFDCGCLIFDNESQDTGAGGSGCGCSASTLCGYILPRMAKGEYRKILFCATGALMSPTSSQQGNSIPGIAHAIEIMM